MTVVTVTLNPAIDHVISLRRLVPGKALVVSESRMYSAGKGLNVGRIAAGLGIPSVAVMAVGNTEVSMFRQAENEKLRVEIIETGNPTRVNTTIYQSEDAATTHLRSPSPPLSEEVIAGIFARLDTLVTSDAIVVIAGSVPGGTRSSVMSQLVSQMGKKATAVVLDSSGSGLADGIRGGPAWVKPSRQELEELVGRPLRSIDEIIQAARTINDKGVEHVVVSLGEIGIVATIASRPGHAKVRISKRYVPVPVHPVGAGDAFVGGLAAAIAMGLPYRNVLGLGVGAATASLSELDPGSIDPGLARRLADVVEFENAP